MDDCQVIVCGAGPAGLMQALLLASAGVKVRIFDKNVRRADESRALAIQSRTMEIFAQFNLIENFLKLGRKVDKAEMHAYGQTLKLKFDSLQQMTAFPFILILEQSKTEELLEDHLATFNVLVEREKELLSFDQDADGVVATFKNLATQQTEQLHAQYLVGADGAHSKIRHGLNLSFQGAPYLQEFWLADITVDQPWPEDQFTMFVNGNGFVGFIPLTYPHTFRLIGSLNKHQSQDSTLTFDRVKAMLTQTLGQAVAISQPVWLTLFHLHHRIANTMQQGRVFIIGDAAHIHSPVGGQGMNTGIQDAFNLAWKLTLVLQAKTNAKILESFSQERLPVGEYLLKKSDRLFEIVSPSTKSMRLLKSIFFHAAPWLAKILPGTTRKFAEYVSQIKIRYRQSLLVQKSLLTTQPAAGDRAPWVLINHLDIFSLFKPNKHTVLIFLVDIDTALAEQLAHWSLDSTWASNPVVIAKRSITNLPHTMIDKTGRAMKKYHIKSNTLFIIRPDQYVLHRFDNFNISQVEIFWHKYLRA